MDPQIAAAVTAVESAASAFLQATSPSERAAAEALLLQFRRSAQPLVVCRQLLAHSAVPYARFQALCTLRECLGREWPRVGAAEQDELQALLLHVAAEASGVSYVQGQAVQVVAVHAKLAVLHNTSAGGGGPCAAMESLQARVAQLLESADPAHQHAGLQLLHGVLGEFGAPHSGGIGGGLSWGLHARARLAFQTSYLLPLFHRGLQQLQRLRAPRGTAPRSPDPRPWQISLRSSALASAQSICDTLTHSLTHSLTHVFVLRPMLRAGAPALQGPGERHAAVLPLLTAAASLLTTALSWDFEGVGAAVGSGGGGSSGADEGGDEQSRPGLNATSVRPPASCAGWREVLCSPELAGCVLQLHDAVAAPPAAAGAAGGFMMGGGGGGGGGDNEATDAARHALRQLLVQLASVGRRLFSGLPAEAPAACNLLLLHAAASLLGAPSAADAGAAALAARVSRLPSGGGGGGCDAAFVDGAALLLRLVASAGEAIVGWPEQSMQCLLQLLHAASMRALGACLSGGGGGGGDGDDDDGSREREASDLLMEVWVSLLSQMGGPATRQGRPPIVDEASWRVYEAAVQMRVSAASAAVSGGGEGGGGGEEVAEEEEAVEAAAEAERHVSLAMLGRAKPREAAAMLQAAIAPRCTQLQAAFEAAGRGAAPPPSQVEALHEEIDVLVRLAGHLLADDGEGSDAREVPAEIAAASVAGAPPESHLAVVLSEAVLSLLRLQLQAVMAIDDPRVGPLSSVLSPALGTTLLWFVERLTASYLTPDEAVTSVLCPPLLAIWGRDAPGAAALLSTCAEAAAVYLLRWRGEDELASAASEVLSTLARLKGSAPQLAPLAAWQRLASLPPPSLPPRSRRQLSEALCRAAVAAPMALQAAALAALRDPLHARLAAATDLSSLPPSGGAAAAAEPSTTPAGIALLRDPARMHEVLAICDGLRGCSRASSHLTIEPIFMAVAPTLPALGALVCAYAHDGPQLIAILKAHRDLARAQMSGLPAQQALQLAQAAHALVGSYVRHVPPPPADADATAADTASGGGAGAGGAGGGGAASAAAAQAQHEAYQQVRALLTLLTEVAARELDAAAPPGAADAMGHATLAAMELLLPRGNAACFGARSLSRERLAGSDRPIGCLLGHRLSPICHSRAHAPRAPGQSRRRS